MQMSKYGIKTRCIIYLGKFIEEKNTFFLPTKKS